MKRQNKITTLAALTAAAALVLTGCSSDGNGGEGSGGGNGEEVVFVNAVGSNPPHLNTQLNTDVTTTVIARSVFETLVNLDGSYEVFPVLATEWEVNDTATQYTFKLREDVQWHDGEPFTSADVKFNLDEVLPLHPLGTTLSNVQESVETPDDYTVVVNLSEPFAPYIEAMSSHAMLPAHLYEGTDITTNEYNLAPVGTGPFKFDEFVEGSHVHVVKNENYWGEVTNIDRVVFQIMPDANARILALRSGEVDLIAPTFMDAAQVETLRADENLMLSRDTSLPSVMSLFFNSENGPTADSAVRAALYQAMDRQAIADNVFYGMAAASRGPIPAAIEWAADDSIDYTEEFAYDPDAAAAALDEAGYPADSNGDRFEINLRVASSFATYVGTAEVIKSNLEAIGVGVNILAEDLNVFVDQTYTQHNFDMSIMAFSSYEDASLGVSRLYVCNPDSVAFRNPTLLCDEEVDAAFDAAAQVADREERAAHFADAERRIAELLHTVPLVDDMSEAVVRTDRWANVEEFSSVINFDYSKLRAA